MGLQHVVYRVLWVLKALWIILSEKLQKKKKNVDAPKSFNIGLCAELPLVVTIAKPYFDSLLRRFEVVFWCL